MLVQAAARRREGESGKVPCRMKMRRSEREIGKKRGDIFLLLFLLRFEYNAPAFSGAKTEGP